MKFAIVVLMMVVAFANAAVFRARTLGEVYEAPLPEGFTEDIIIENLLPAPGSPAAKPIYRARTPAVTHEADLPLGYTQSVYIDNL